MSKPKNMSPEEWKVIQSARNRIFRESNPEYAKTWWKENACKNKGRSVRWRKANPEKARIQRKLARNRAKEKGKARNRGDRRAQEQRARKNLSDKYVATLMGLSTTLVRRLPGLIEAKREQVQIIRILKPKTKKQNAPESK